MQKQLATPKQEKKEVVEVDGNLKGYLDFSFDLAAHLDKFYQWADYQTKNTFLSSIFPDKVVYDGEGKYRTPNANRVIALFCGLDPNFEVAQMQKGTFYSAFLEMGTPEGTRVELFLARFETVPGTSRTAEIAA